MGATAWATFSHGHYYISSYIMKPIMFCGRSLKIIGTFPTEVKREAGYQLERVQFGLAPMDWKPLPSVGIGIKEIRLRDNGQYRVIYLAAFENKVAVLHAFQKKSRKTSKPDIQVARRALKDLLNRSVS